MPTVTVLCSQNFACTNVPKTILSVRKSVYANIKFVEPCKSFLNLKCPQTKYVAKYVAKSVGISHNHNKIFRLIGIFVFFC